MRGSVNHRRPWVKSLIVAVVLTTPGAALGVAPASPPGAAPAPSLGLRRPGAVSAQLTTYAALPLRFEPAAGGAGFVARGVGYTIVLGGNDVTLALGPPVAVRIRLLGATASPLVREREELPGKSHYFLGRDPRRWRTGVPGYARIEYEDIYPGIDLVWYGNQGRLEYDFVVRPGSDPSRIRLVFEGAERLILDERGHVVITTPAGEVVQRAPLIYQEIGGVRRQVSGAYELRGAREVGFTVAAYDPARPLVIDPVLVYSTYLGGGTTDIGIHLAVDAGGNAYVTGTTRSGDFPTVDPAQPTIGGASDVFVAKIDATGTALVYATYLGGRGDDAGVAIAVDAGGSAYLTGSTLSSDFPTMAPLQATTGGGTDAFVVKLDPTGRLAYSTYLGGAGADNGLGLAVGADGSAYVVGFTGSLDFPTVAALQGAYGGGDADAFLSKLSPDGSALIYSTYVGGMNRDKFSGVAIDAAGNVVTVGGTCSADFPIVNALQPVSAGSFDAVVTKIGPDGSTFLFSTHLGGLGEDKALALALDAAGDIYVAGYTFSTDFPTVGPMQPANHGKADAFVSKLTADGSTLLYSTYLGGGGEDRASGVAVDAVGNAYVMGETRSGDFPTVTPLQPPRGGGADAFVTKLDAAGATIVYSTHLGGTGSESVVFYVSGEIALDLAGNAYVAGFTTSTDFPTVTPIQGTNANRSAAFVAKIAEGLFTLTATRSGTGSGTVLSTPSGIDCGAVCSAPYLADTTVTLTATPADGSIFSGWSGDPDCGDGAVTLTASKTCTAHFTRLLADLAVASLLDPPPGVSLGGSFVVTDTTRNDGTASADASTTSYYLTLATGGAKLRIGGRVVPALGPGESSTDSATATVPATTPPATYLLVACADDPSVVMESGEQNNCRTATASVTVTP